MLGIIFPSCKILKIMVLIQVKSFAHFLGSRDLGQMLQEGSFYYFGDLIQLGVK